MSDNPISSDEPETVAFDPVPSTPDALPPSAEISASAEARAEAAAPPENPPPADDPGDPAGLAAPAPDGVQRANRLVDDGTYGTLRDDDRVVMRHAIALNLDSFRASSEDFVEPRQARAYPALVESAPSFFSVVIANHNGQRHLPVVLDALRAQTFSDFETIVVDDASDDDSTLIVERDYPEVRLIVNRANAGFAVTCNTGAAAATGHYVVMLNSDTEPDPHWLEALALACVANPGAAAIASKMLLFDRRTVIHTSGDLMGRDGLARNRGAWQPDNGQFDAQRTIFSACGGAAAYRRDIWQALGGFDEHFWMYLEDVDYGFRAQLAGYGSVFAPDARVYHHLSATSGDVMASYYVGRNALWVIAKNMPDGLLRANLPAIVCGQLRIAGDALRAFQGEAARARLRGQLAGLLGIRAVLLQRKYTQMARRVEEADLARLLE